MHSDKSPICSVGGENAYFLIICKKGCVILFGVPSLGPKSVTNQRKRTSLQSFFFFPKPFMLNSAILDEAVTMTGYISLWNSN